MRKLLLATVAALGASMGAAGYADAQVVFSTDDGASQNDDSGQAFPTPGTVTVRLNGRFRFYIGAFTSGAARTTNNTIGAAQGTGSVTNSAGATVASATTAAQGLNKDGNYGIVEYARLYPGFDGVAANGLKYGASLEIRQDNNAAAGGGVFSGPTTQDRSEGLLYLRREWGYIGTDGFGTLRLGASDQVTSLFLTGNFENFDAGGLDGDLPFGLAPGNTTVTWPFADQGNLYSTNKIVYVSPQFYGFDGGVDWEPNTGAVGNSNSGGCGPSGDVGTLVNGGQNVASPGCDSLTSTSTNDYLRRRNTYDALLRYRGTFGPIGIATTASYTGSGRVLDSGIVGSTTNPKHVGVEDLSMGDFGLVLTYGGLSVGGNYEFGRYNAQSGGGYGALIAKGQPNSSALVVGASYTIGPIIFGAQYLRSFSMGDEQTAINKTVTGGALPSGSVLGGQRFEEGFATGATYSVAPGLAVFLSYVWQERRQTGYNFVTGASNNAFNNKLNSQLLGIGTSFAW
jgi:hypothetical protein